MVQKALLLVALCATCHASGLLPAAAPVAPAPLIEPAPIIAPAGVILPPPVVAATSSQYFERIFNRLVVAPPVVEAPVLPFAPTPTVLTTKAVPASTADPFPVDVAPAGPNFAFAVATAQAAPISTILLPPYPFAPQPIGFIPPVNAIPTEPTKKETEPTTARPKNPNTATSPLPNGVFPQGLPTDQQPNFSRPQKLEAFNQNGLNQYAVPNPPKVQNFKGFNQYEVPKPQKLESFNQNSANKYQAPAQNFNQNPAPQPAFNYQAPRPEKLKTSVEVVPVPLTYIAPPPLKLQPIKHAHKFVPKTKIIIRPVSSPIIIRPIRLIVRSKPYSKTILSRSSQTSIRGPQPQSKDVEPTTFNPLVRPNTKPPRVF